MIFRKSTKSRCKNSTRYKNTGKRHDPTKSYFMFQTNKKEKKKFFFSRKKFFFCLGIFWKILDFSENFGLPTKETPSIPKMTKSMIFSKNPKFRLYLQHPVHIWYQNNISCVPNMRRIYHFPRQLCLLPNIIDIHILFLFNPPPM